MITSEQVNFVAKETSQHMAKAFNTIIQEQGYRQKDNDLLLVLAVIVNQWLLVLESSYTGPSKKTKDELLQTFIDTLMPIVEAPPSNPTAEQIKEADFEVKDTEDDTVQ